MNPLTASDGSSRVVVRDARVVDDGNFFTQNKPSLGMRAYRVEDGEGRYLAGVAEPRPVGWRVKKEGAPPWIVTRDELAQLDLARFGQGKRRIRVWGVNDDDATFFEVGSEDSAHAGVDVVIATDFVVGPAPPDPLTLLRQGVTQLERSDAYKKGFTNVVAGTKKCRKALEELT